LLRGRTSLSIRGTPSPCYHRELHLDLTREVELVHAGLAACPAPLNASPYSAHPIVEDFDRETASQAQLLRYSHRRQLAEFEDHWNIGLIAKYALPSAAVRALRLRRHEHAAAGDGDTAAALDAEADALEVREREAAAARFRRDCAAARTRLEERMRAQKRAFAAGRERLRARVLLRVHGLYVGPVERLPPPRSITATRPPSPARVRAPALPALCDAGGRRGGPVTAPVSPPPEIESRPQSPPADDAELQEEEYEEDVVVSGPFVTACGENGGGSALGSGAVEMAQQDADAHCADGPVLGSDLLKENPLEGRDGDPFVS
jgi:hypothetical protein